MREHERLKSIVEHEKARIAELDLIDPIPGMYATCRQGLRDIHLDSLRAGSVRNLQARAKGGKDVEALQLIMELYETAQKYLK